MAELGPVEHIVSPNALHSRYMEQYAEAYPSARLWASPGLRRKRPDLDFQGKLTNEPEAAWASDLDSQVFEGLRLLREVCFLHRSSRTLVLTDLAARFEEPLSRGARMWSKAMGTHARLGTPRGLRLFPREKAAAKASAERILSWDFDRVIVGHGRGVETGGKAELRAAWGWILGRS